MRLLMTGTLLDKIQDMNKMILRSKGNLDNTTTIFTSNIGVRTKIKLLLLLSTNLTIPLMLKNTSMKLLLKS